MIDLLLCGFVAMIAFLAGCVVGWIAGMRDGMTP